GGDRLPEPAACTLARPAGGAARGRNGRRAARAGGPPLVRRPRARLRRADDRGAPVAAQAAAAALGAGARGGDRDRLRGGRATLAGGDLRDRVRPLVDP